MERPRVEARLLLVESAEKERSLEFEALVFDVPVGSCQRALEPDARII
jgi:hypothetical protein